MKRKAQRIELSNDSEDDYGVKEKADDDKERERWW